MALKFLNKKGWHTGSLRNIENVWKAEQKHEAEQRKLEELRKQIHEERERSEFRLLQEQAGLVPKQERLDFLYESGLGVGKGSSDGFTQFQSAQKTEAEAPQPSSSSSKPSSTPGALFEEKPQSANDAWRKLHSDPLLLIRQRQQEALARVKNNPIQMAMIRKSVEAKQQNEGLKKELKKHRHKTKKHDDHTLPKRHSDSEDATMEKERRKGGRNSDSKYDKQSSRDRSDSDNDASEREEKRRKREKLKQDKHSSSRSYSEIDANEREEKRERSSRRSMGEKRSTETRSSTDISAPGHWHGPQHRQRKSAPKLSEEERAARLREMQLDAELHEEQRWKRLKKAADSDAQEASQAQKLGGRNFLDDARKSVYGAEKGGSSTIEESVRRRMHYSQRRSDASDSNAFRR
ncbi:hypothetical protein Syun_010615 [Stephania yunnanensis]|uniref:CBF1-interacting co-repressor CIR N-terminal domain-containing protein n=1 Tax=Stephania yunnanensis TaxID=152371 RepID=A0AAP0PTF0_9MAGN